MLFTIALFVSALLHLGSGVTFSQDSATVNIPTDFPVGTPIYQVIVIDDVTGRRPENISFEISGITAFPSPPSSRGYDALFAIDKRLGTVRLSPRQMDSLADFANHTFALKIIPLINGKRKANSKMKLFVRITKKKFPKDGRDDICEPKEELCFSSTEYLYELPETTAGGAVVGNVMPVTHLGVCPRIKNSYSIYPDGPLYVRSSTGELELLQTLDYEVKRKYNFNISCRITYEVENSTVSAIFTKDAILHVKDVNDNAPYLQVGSKSEISLDAYEIMPGRPLPVQFTVLDKDSPEVNDIKVELDDPLSLFTANDLVIFHDVYQAMLVNTAVVPKKDFYFDGPYYNFSVIFRDVGLINSSGAEAVFHVTIYNRTTSNKISIPKSCQLAVTISSHAGQHTRIGQPFEVREQEGYSFELLPATLRDDVLKLFNTTTQTGIVYVQQDNSLLDRVNVTYEFLLTWRNEDAQEGKCKVTATIQDDGDFSLGDCGELEPGQGLATCARLYDESSCNSSCGRGSPDGSCQWRSHAPTTNPTSRFATCSPDLSTCPNGHCDELEAMDSAICPQDCASEVQGQGFLSHLGRGIAMAAVPCTCDGKRTCICTPTLKNPRRDRLRRRKKVKGSPNESTPAPSHMDNYTVQEACDGVCVAVIASVATVVASFVLVALLLVARQVRNSHLDKHRYVANRVPLTAVVSDYVDDRILTTESTSDTALDKPLVEAKWEFRRDRLILQETLGEGEFGKVVKAQAWNIGQRPGFTTVAVKTLKANGTSAEEQDLLSELNLLREVSHPNVIKLLGASTTKGGPLYIIVEYAELGSLRAYLRKIRQLRHNPSSIDNPSYFQADLMNSLYPSEDSIKQELLSFAWQIAKGMAYLSDMKLVHRDLAARNILLAQNKVVKISDFGLSRDVYEGDTYLKTTKGRVPVKWMAIESLEDHIYTIKSDVWSFGIVLWEIITLGSTPYPGVTPERLYHLLKGGYRMPQPDGCSNKLYKIMRKCWRSVPHERPSFKELVEKLDKFLQDKVEYLPLGPDGFMPSVSQYENPLVPNSINIIAHKEDISANGGPSTSKTTKAHRPPSLAFIRSDSGSNYENRQLLQSHDEMNSSASF